MRYDVGNVATLGQRPAVTPDLPNDGLAGFVAAHDGLFTRLCQEAGAARWEVSRDEFAQALYRSAAHRFGESLPGADGLVEYFGSLHLDDLALACALRRGSAPAWEEFVARYRAVLYAAARAIVGSAGEARSRELADSLYAELYGLNRRPLLDYFHGRSKFSTWLRAVLAQRHVDALRASQRTDSLDEDTSTPSRLAAHFPSRADAADPDRARLLPRLQQAVATALETTPSADRLLLSLYYVQEMTLAQIARLQGVHEATISRQLDRIRRALRSGVEQSLAAGRAAANGAAALPMLSPAEVKLCFDYALQDWSFDLSRALSGTGIAGREGT